ncbi:MAG: uroporphyrinogen-III synthase [Gammaproteobacteria bacterium]|nr:uroporphyrinogen-III synthase [Gammaproteobacteria bacterium]
MDINIMPLTGRHILVTRPEPQGAHLCELLAKMGAYAYYIPTLEIRPCAINLSLFQPDIAIFISANAVKYYPFNKFPKAVRYFAVGVATTIALMQRGVIAQQPEKSSSEGLLDLTELQQVNEKEVAIFCGVGGRTVLQETLKKRGARCQRYEVYQRYAAVNEAQRLQSLLKKIVLDYVICTSGENLLSLEQLSGSQRTCLHQTPLVVISDRIAVLAKKQGFTQVLAMSESFDNIGIVQQLVKYSKEVT